MPREFSTTKAALQPLEEKGEEPVTVLVTGFGPFLDKYPLNTSWLLASTLPALLPSTPNQPTPIHIHVHHAPLRVAYHTVASLVPTLLPPESRMYPPADIILHIGLVAGRSYYTLERGARRIGYDRVPDVDGKRWEVEDGERVWPSADFPDALRTGFQVDDVLARWKRNIGYEDRKPDSHTANETASNSTTKPHPYSSLPDIRISPDAGNFLCGFSYYTSLAHYFALNRDIDNRHEPNDAEQSRNQTEVAARDQKSVASTPVAFLHVPDLSRSEAALEIGKKVVVGLIRALVESRRCVGIGDGIDVGEEKDEEEGNEGAREIVRMDGNFTGAGE